MSSRSILVADDDAMLRELLQQVLEAEGHRVTCAVDGREASRKLAAGSFDLLITDVLMPGQDGLELIGAARRRHPALRIIVMTGGGHIPQDHYLKVAKSMGANGVLQKPFERGQLLQAVEAAWAD